MIVLELRDVLCRYLVNIEYHTILFVWDGADFPKGGDYG